MADLTSQDMAAKLIAGSFPRTGPAVEALSDPIADTPMVVTLDELRPYELDPRITRNPLFDDIKASIKERGLDAPPPITRRPGAAHYIIRNGGNTRLAILRELWSETKDERFFRIACLFRPWPERGEIIALTGHLAENELHGGLSFIERALGIEKARELYEQEDGRMLSQSQLARRLSADGYPVQQSHISRMQETVRYMLPAIPNVLYGGLGRHQIERLVILRKASERTWEERAQDQHLAVDFGTLFHDVLASFDAQPDGFSTKRVRDELIGHMARMLGADYDTLSLEIDDTETRQRALVTPPRPVVEPSDSAPVAARSEKVVTRPPVPPQPRQTEPSPRPASEHAPVQPPQSSGLAPAHETAAAPAVLPKDDKDERLQGHIVSPAPSTDRLQAIQQLVADHTGEALPSFADNVLRAIPVQAGGLYPISDVWYIEPGLDSPERLRVHIAQFAREIAEEARLSDCIEPTDDRIGFVCSAPGTDAKSMPASGHAILALLDALSRSYGPVGATPVNLDRLRLSDDLAPLLQGQHDAHPSRVHRLSDNGLVKLFRLLRLARRLLELEMGVANGDGPPP
ncbi:ParB family protein [Rhodanobacter lindaniclasticus]